MKNKGIDSEKFAKAFLESKNNMIKDYIKHNFVIETIPLLDFLSKLEREIIIYTMKVSENNQRKTAFLLGLKPTTLNEKIKKLKIEIEDIDKKDAVARSFEEIGTFFDPE